MTTFHTVRELILDGRYDDALNELDALEEEARAAGFMWPPGVMDLCVDQFGEAVLNPHGRMHKALARRIIHAMNVWGRRYFDLSIPELEAYAGEVLCFAIKAGVQEAKKKNQPYYPFVYRKLETVVHLDAVHEGFKRRLPKASVSVADVLANID